MGLIERLGRIQSHCRRLCWRIRAAATKTTSKQQVRFQYDPYSYAMNFDDGFEKEIRVEERGFEEAKCEECVEKRRIFVYVVVVN